MWGGKAEGVCGFGEKAVVDAVRGWVGIPLIGDSLLICWDRSMRTEAEWAKCGSRQSKEPGFTLRRLAVGLHVDRINDSLR